MTEPLDQFDSDRHFQLWRYSVSHSQLLLRSNRDGAHPSRVEVLFKGVDHVELPTSFDGLHAHREGRRFAVHGPNWSGSVTALAMFTAEEDAEYHEPSTLYIDGVG